MIRRILSVVVGVILTVSVFRAVGTVGSTGEFKSYTFTAFLQYAETLQPPEVSIPLINLSSWPDWLRWLGEALNGIITAVNGVSTFVGTVFYFFYSIWQFLLSPPLPA